MPDTWKHFQQHFYENQEIGIQLDFSRMQNDERAVSQEQKQIMFSGMKQLEQGAVSNPDEKRMVGHYWLRKPSIAPTKEIQNEILRMQEQVQQFVQKIHRGEIRTEKNQTFAFLLVIGIGGSSLGPCFAVQALEEVSGKGLKAYFMDNTDPDGMDRIFETLSPHTDEVLTLVISKSGSTVETRNGMEETRLFYQKQGLHFERHAAAVTQKESLLYQICQQEQWLDCFPMWDWVGGRTSITSAVGLLPLALAGVDIQQFLAGAAKTDEVTRIPDLEQNPAALLASSWYQACKNDNRIQMIILPYKDRLQLLTSYLQQLVMESLGKEVNLRGDVVHQGLVVWGRKGSSDQHSYMQQLLDGPDNFFLTFIEVLKDRTGTSPVIAENSTSGDFLHAFLLGSREALQIRRRQTLTLTMPEIDAFHLGVLIALYERAVGFYAGLMQINAYNQPAVEIGKKSASTFIALKNCILQEFKKHPQQFFTVEELAQRIQKTGQYELIFKLVQHLWVNEEHIQAQSVQEGPWKRRYGWIEP